MKKNVIIALVILSSFSLCHSQDTTMSNISEEPFVFHDQMPEFPGGDDALMLFIQKNLKYPKDALKKEIEGVVMVNFMVGADGIISKANVTKGIGMGCDEEAIRIILSMPKWKPGKQGGQYVPVYFDIPVNFTLQ